LVLVNTSDRFSPPARAAMTATRFAPREHVDGGVKRGGEQHPLPVARRGLEQPPDDREETEVGHLVRLVDDRDLHVGQVALALPDQVGEPAGGGDHDVGPALQGVHLRSVGDPAVNGGDLQVHGARQGLEHLRHLGRQLAGRDEDQAARPRGERRPAGQPADEGEGEAKGLARAGLRPAEDVTARQRVGQRGRLDGERRRDALVIEDLDEWRGHAEAGEGAVGGQVVRGRGGTLCGHGSQRKIVSRTRGVANAAVKLAAHA
jgi:hypothetical protein